MPRLKHWLHLLFRSPLRSLAGIVTFGMVSLLAAAPVHAGLWDVLSNPKDAVLNLISWLLYYLTIVLYGFLATLATKLLVYVAQFNNFTDLPVIIEAWSVVRDLANMFFIVILLVIAFGTLFRIEAYSWKKLLPKMVLMAILVNYSRAICGFIVDASQVVMLTFVAAIKDAADVGIVEAFQLRKLLSFENELDEVTGQPVQSSSQRLIAIMAAGSMLIILFMVQMVYVVVLVGRLVMIWFLTVLSPLAYVANILPQTEKYSSQWWEMFSRYVVVGPLCMFFLWLGMFVAAKSVDSGGLGTAVATDELREQALDNASEAGAGALDTSLIAGFIIASMMLMAGMKLAQDNASEMGGAIGKVKGLSKFVLAAAPVAVGAVGALGAKTAADKIYEGTGFDMNVSRQWHKLQHKREDIKRKREAKGYTKAFAAAQRGNIFKGWLGAADFAYEQYTPVLGKQGLWGKHGQRGMLNRWYGNRKFKEANAQMEAMSGKRDKDKEALDATRAGLRNQYTTVEHRDRKLKENEAAREDVESTPDNGQAWDMHAGTETGAMAQSVLEQLREERSKTTDVGEAQRLTQEIDALNAAMSSGEGLPAGGTVDVRLVGRLGDRLNNAKRDRLQQLRDEKDDWTKKEVTDRDGNALATQEQLDAFIAKETQAQQQALDEANEALRKHNEKIMEEYAPVIDYEGSQATEEVLAAERKKYAGEENEDVLKELLKAKFHENDGVAALGVIQQAASVGHLNEMMDAMGLSQSFEGMQQLAQRIQDELGVDQQMVLAAFDQASKSAKHINHWAFAEAVTQQNGVYKWRGKDEHLTRRYVEMSKAGMNNIARSGNRLAYGGYNYNPTTHEQEWEPDAPAIALLVQQLPRLGDAAQKGMLNNSAGENIFSKWGGKYERQIIETIKATFGEGTPEATDALIALKKWKQATFAKNRAEGDMYGIAAQVAEKHKKAA